MYIVIGELTSKYISILAEIVTQPVQEAQLLLR